MARFGLVIVAVVLLIGMIGFSVAPPAEPGTSVRRAVTTTGKIPLPAVFRSRFGYARLVLGPATGILIPAVLCVVLGGIVAGESERGTLAEALAHPTARWKIVAAKTGAGLVYSALLVCVAALCALAVSSLVLETGDLITGQTVETTEVDGVEVRRPAFEKIGGTAAASRLVLAYALAGVGLGALVSLVVLASATAERSRTATLVAAGSYFGLYVVTHTQGIGKASRYLVLNHFEMWRAVLRTEIAWGRVWRGVSVLAVVFALLTAAAMMVLGGREFPSRPDV